ncbi:MAG: hypothetical protein M8364_19795 [Methylobacter sp.]|uniref:hypothetical protein n=1 Tax=Methylobacter sp. TaxID=2051955 RepID=UPI00258385A9|nr:hypothetical protein [Methylobacter sp.]MCL7423139.1 hypothetical protein [Methylobacter sp.]
MAKEYRVRLTADDRTYLQDLIHKGKVAAYKRLHAEILLKADISEWGEKWQPPPPSVKPLGFQRERLNGCGSGSFKKG